MKAKTLLIAAAALVAGVISSEAQVYSANIVGYVNVVLPGNGQYTLVANPLDDGNGNYLSNIISAPLPGGVANTFGQSKITTFGIPNPGVPNAISKLASGLWNISPQLPPGNGFYVQNGQPGKNAPDLTNTFVGNVLIAPGAHVTNQIPTGFSLQGSSIPLGGNVAISGTPSGDPNLDYGSALVSPSSALKSTVIYFNTGTQSPATVTKLAATGNWNGTANISVGQGFYLDNLGPIATNMVQTLP